ncbi:piRNA biogenesis protein EXD1-like isoform X2 [Portunus trituberculatus]|uniref:piRNA biogenesis protein EXD1-like isoform X2 n=1 Tax=Portunus trituberculatus TaxID=210409 RepID=UPI001E1CCDD8|nr:piRNA biogenesis protein EXD1-like isoform X2 [Portunus trituberculatus]
MENKSNTMLQPDPSVSLSSLENEGRDFTLEEILDLGDDSLGLKVLLTTKQSSWLGVINIILKTCGKISLEKDMYFEKQQGKKLLRKKLLPMDLQEKCCTIIPKEEVVPGLIQHLLTEEARVKSSSPSPQSPERLPRPSKWIVIDVVDDSYDKALSMICKEMVISLGMAGLGVGRSGTLVWLSVATSSVIFHFDVAKIGVSEVMEGGLGMVLQDSKVVKVVHDCRGLEDLLHHQLKLNLCNVFDTQAAEIYLHLLNQKGSVPLLVPTLTSLLIKHLNLNIYHLFPDGQEYSKVDDSLWLERPLAKSLGEHLARDVMYLRELRLEQLDMMLVDLRQIFEIYLGAMRDKDSLTLSQLEPQVVPAEVQKLGKQPVLSVKHGGLPFVQHFKGAPNPSLWQ